MLSAVIMGVAGFAVGILLDRLALRLAWPISARESQEAGEDPRIDLPETGPGGLAALASERGELYVHPAFSVRTVIVVAVTAAAFAVIGARYDGVDHALLAAAWASVVILCGATDAMSFRVPNVVTYPAILAALAAGLVMSEANRLDVLAGGLAAGGLLLIPALFTTGMGMGDAKLAAFAGFALGLTKVIYALVVMALAGGLIAAGFLVFRMRSKGAPMPYAPYIALGVLFVLLSQGTAYVTLSP